MPANGRSARSSSVSRIAPASARTKPAAAPRVSGSRRTNGAIVAARHRVGAGDERGDGRARPGDREVHREAEDRAAQQSEQDQSPDAAPLRADDDPAARDEGADQDEQQDRSEGAPPERGGGRRERAHRDRRRDPRRAEQHRGSRSRQLPLPSRHRRMILRRGASAPAAREAAGSRGGRGSRPVACRYHRGSPSPRAAPRRHRAPTASGGSPDAGTRSARPRPDRDRRRGDRRLQHRLPSHRARLDRRRRPRPGAPVRDRRLDVACPGARVPGQPVAHGQQARAGHRRDLRDALRRARPGLAEHGQRSRSRRRRRGSRRRSGARPTRSRGTSKPASSRPTRRSRRSRCSTRAASWVRCS